MDDLEIKRLLSLDANPYFVLSDKDAAKLAEWKSSQEKLPIRKAKKMEVPAGFEIDDGLGDGTEPTIVEKPKRARKTKNIVSSEDKELG